MVRRVRVNSRQPVFSVWAAERCPANTDCHSWCSRDVGLQRRRHRWAAGLTPCGAEARAAHPFADYSYEIQTFCFCPPEVNQWTRVR
jgi:hypothetical protein